MIANEKLEFLWEDFRRAREQYLSIRAQTLAARDEIRKIQKRVELMRELLSIEGCKDLETVA
jgi:hypothetical protein